MPTLSLPIYEPVAINSDERAFFIALGGRIARLRKDQDITQAQLAELIGVTQQTMAHYEGGVSRIAVETLTQLADALGVSIEDLIGTQRRSAGKRGPAPKLQQQMDRITQLPRARQQFVMQVIESVLAQADR